MAGRPITVGTDGSKQSLMAVEWAAREAVLHSAPLRIVSALPPLMSSRHQPPGPPDTVGDVVRPAPAHALASAVERAAALGPGLTIEATLLSGPPMRALVDSSADSAMLVVGSHRTGKLSAMVLGSVSRYVATHAQCPVVVAREETRPAYRQVVVGVGDLDQSAAALEFAFAEAALRRARLVAVHAWSCFMPATAPLGVPAGARQAPAGPCYLAPDTAARIRDLFAGWRAIYPDVAATVETVHAHPGRQLAEVSIRADLIVLGRWPTGAGNSAKSSVTHTVLSHAHGPVAVVTG